MSARSHGLTEAFHAYMLAHFVKPSPAAEGLAAAAETLPERNMRMATEQGRFMAFLIELIGAKHVIEVGTFVGYGTLWMAEALPKDGRIVALDIEPRFAEIGRPFWRQAKVEDRIDLRIGPALESLAAMRKDGGAGRFDMAFIDADKKNYPTYYEQCLQLLRPGGLLLIDNVFWDGAVADPEDTSAETAVIRALNTKILADARVSAATVPIGDGLTIARKL